MSSSVKIISYTNAPGTPEDKVLTDLIAYTARVSNPSNQDNKATQDKLLKYLMKNQHWSPFEMVNVCMEIKTTRDIARQILRHRSFSFQEFSQRYAVANSFTLREARIQDTKNRQNSHDNLDIKLERDWLNKQQDLVDKARELYEWALENKIAKEQARAVLPEGLTNSTLYMNGTLRSWIHYIDLRIANGTQKEHREVAEKCLEQISKIFPAIQGK
jgi:thymidylate synthase (FAD)